MIYLYWYLGIGVAVLAAVAGVVAWPAALYMKGKEIFGKKSESALDEERQFAVGCSHLQECLTVLQIETREVVRTRWARSRTCRSAT